MRRAFLPRCDVLCGGSYPFTDAGRAARVALSGGVIVPHWPQLPRKSPKERMIAQTLAAMKSRDGSFPRGYAAGWNAAWRELGRKRERDEFQPRSAPPTPYFKSHITGPVTLAAEASGHVAPAKWLARNLGRWLRHAEWQAREIEQRGFTAILVLDEPVFPVAAKELFAPLREAIDAIRKFGAVAGIHCCNRVSPRDLAETGADLLHFDVIHFPTLLAPARPALQDFLRQGGVIAWGVVPTTEPLDPRSLARIEKIFLNAAESMQGRGLALRAVLERSLVAPVCGTGLLKVRHAVAILDAASEISKRIKSRYKLD